MDVQPWWPVTAELKEVIEVDQLRAFQIIYDWPYHLIGGKGSKDDEISFNPKLLIRQVEAGIKFLAY